MSDQERSRREYLKTQARLRIPEPVCPSCGEQVYYALMGEESLPWLEWSCLKCKLAWSDLGWPIRFEEYGL